jgi:hypothetical protein
MLNVICVTFPGGRTVLHLVISPFAACQGSLLASIDRRGGVYPLCGDHLLVGICRDFLLESFALCYCVFFLSSASLCYEFSACCLGYVLCGRHHYCNDYIQHLLFNI